MKRRSLGHSHLQHHRRGKKSVIRGCYIRETRETAQNILFKRGERFLGGVGRMWFGVVVQRRVPNRLSNFIKLSQYLMESSPLEEDNVLKLCLDRSDNFFSTKATIFSAETVTSNRLPTVSLKKLKVSVVLL